MSDFYQCTFCQRKVKLEKTLLTHKCPRRDRYNNKDTRLAQVGLLAYKEFMDYNKLRIPKAVLQGGDLYMYFIQSKLFPDFDALAHYVTENDIFKPEEFITHLIRSGLSARLWCTHRTHQEWVLKCTRYEHPDTGINRSIHALMDWENLTGNQWNTFFKDVSITRFIQWIESGKISPWLIYASTTADELLCRISPTEYQHLLPYIDPGIWMPLQLRYSKEVNTIRNNLKGFGL